MIKRTIYFGSPTYLSLRNGQLVVDVAGLTDDKIATQARRTIPVEDIGIVVLDNRQITITYAVIEALLANNSAFITCDSSRMPVGMLLPLSGNTTQNERFRIQLDASEPLKKQLWQQTVQAKIANQATALHLERGTEVGNMKKWVSEVRSADPDNLEARAAVYYWANLFCNFTRDRQGLPPNNLLNYGYAILRAVVARALVASGLLPTLGIHHHNRYNAYCLADDVMEPYRPYVDRVVVELYEQGHSELDNVAKSRLLSIPTIEVTIDGQRSPLMIAVGQTTASLFKCFDGQVRRIAYPRMA
ncbi:MAG: type II CRISPR-associated endonuclease Cas1 [Mucinivorans sp.]